MPFSQNSGSQALQKEAIPGTLIPSEATDPPPLHFEAVLLSLRISSVLLSLLLGALSTSTFILHLGKLGYTQGGFITLYRIISGKEDLRLSDSEAKRQIRAGAKKREGRLVCHLSLRLRVAAWPRARFAPGTSCPPAEDLGILEPLRLEKSFRIMDSSCKPNAAKSTSRLRRGTLKVRGEAAKFPSTGAFQTAS